MSLERLKRENKIDVSRLHDRSKLKDYITEQLACEQLYIQLPAITQSILAW